MNNLPKIDIELFQHGNDRRGYVAIYLVEDASVPTRELEYHTENDNCIWVRDATFVTPRLGYTGTVEKIYRGVVVGDSVILDDPNDSFAPHLNEHTYRLLRAELQKLAK